MRTIRDEDEPRRRRERDPDDYEPARCGQYRCVREHPRSIIVSPVGNALEERVVPKSVLHEDTEVWKDGQEGELVVLTWFALREGLA